MLKVNIEGLPRARAVYDNNSESAEELTFKSGDVLRVVERDVAGFGGWWLCYFGDRLGIAPGNRLRMLADDDSGRDSYSSAEVPPLQVPSGVTDQQTSSYDVPGQLTPRFSEGGPWKMRQRTSPNGSMAADLYDSPVAQFGDAGLAAASSGYSSPNRASLLSNMSTGSSALSDSARSSIDSSFATYDVLPARSAVATPSTNNTVNRLTDYKFSNALSLREKTSGTINDAVASRSSCEDQRDSYLEDYSIPRKSIDSSSVSTTSKTTLAMSSLADLYDCPRSYTEPQPQQTNGANIQDNLEQLYDVPQFLTLEKVQSVSLKAFDGYAAVQADLKQSGERIAADDFGRTANEPTSAEDDGYSTYDVPSNVYHPVAETFPLKADIEPHANEIDYSELKKAPMGRKAVLPEPVIPILSWQLDIQKHNAKLRSLVLDNSGQSNYGDDNVSGSGRSSSDDSLYPSVRQSQIKLGCLSLRTAVKELIDFLTDSRMQSVFTARDQYSFGCPKKPFDQEKLKIRIEMLKAALRQFEDCSNELLSSAVASSAKKQPWESQQKVNQNDTLKSTTPGYLKDLLNVANVLPQITDLLIIDLCSYLEVSAPLESNSQDGREKSVPRQLHPAENNYAPLPALQNRKIFQPTDIQQRLTTQGSMDRKSIQNRPLPPTPATFLSDKPRFPASNTANTLPFQPKMTAGVQQRLSMPSKISTTPTAYEMQRLICPTSCNTLPSKKTLLPTVHDSTLQAEKNVGEAEAAEMSRLQKPPLPSSQLRHLYDAVAIHHSPVAAGAASSVLPRQESPPSNPLLGSAESDALLVDFYASQIDSHLELVKKAILDFKKVISVPEPAEDNSRNNRVPHAPPRPIPTLLNHAQGHHHNSPHSPHQQITLSAPIYPQPKEFVLRSKFVILAAHKLVYVADAIARNLADPTPYADVAAAANRLCDILKAAVNATKEAALNHENQARRDLMSGNIDEVGLRSEELCQVISRHKCSPVSFKST